MDMLNRLLIIIQEQSLSTYIVGGATIIVSYLILVHMLRFRYIHALRRKYPDPTLPLRDARVAEEVFDTTFRYDFPSLGRLSLELALFKTYSVPTISKLLVATGEFSKNAAKRAEDTGLILSEMVDPYAHIEIEKRKQSNVDIDKIEAEQRGRAKTAIERLNEIHGKYDILNGDYLYTLSLFIRQPIQWINRYGWRKLDPLEENAIFRIWYDIGTQMKIKDIPESLDAMNAFHLQYMHENVRYSPSNWKVAQPTVEHLLSIYPRFLHGLVYKVLPALLDPLDVQGFGLTPASKSITRMVDNGLLLQAWIVRHLKLPRFKPTLRTPTKPDKNTNRYKVLFDIYKPVYPDGYCIHELGPDKFKPAKCPIAH